jgi:hypothetical protein
MRRLQSEPQRAEEAGLQLVCLEASLPVKVANAHALHRLQHRRDQLGSRGPQQAQGIGGDSTH